MLDLRHALEVAIAAARDAGSLLRADLHRPGGPRGAVDKADADTEAERLVRARLLAAFPAWGYLGEETGRVVAAEGEPIWLVDPNDGTRDYLKGRRASAVSIALLVGRVPRLGVVYAFAYPDDEGDLFTWAEGCGPLRRNGEPLAPVLPGSLGRNDVVLVSSAGDRDAAGNLACASPARFRTVPSIAHRLALAAAGEAAVAVSLNAPGAWDYAGGHALLRGAGATLVDERGRQIEYDARGESRCRWAFGGADGAAAPLASRPWDTLGSGRTAAAADSFPSRLVPGELCGDPARLARAQGCLLGQVAGDSLGSLVEFRSAEDIRRSFPDGPRELADGGPWDTIAGQPTDDSEMALALARSLIAEGGFRAAAVRAAYEAWLESDPVDVGRTTRGSLRGHPDAGSQANGALMRASPLGIFAHAHGVAAAARLAREDALLTHVSPACLDASAAFVVAVAHAVRQGDGAEAAFAAAREWAVGSGASGLVQEALEAARREPPACDGESQGWVRIALQNAFYELLHAPSLEEALVATVRRGGDTDTNAAIAGALLGAVHGREAVPRRWRSLVLSCRTLAPYAPRTRPRVYWPTDALEIAERLLLAGERATSAEGR